MIEVETTATSGSHLSIETMTESEAIRRNVSKTEVAETTSRGTETTTIVHSIGSNGVPTTTKTMETLSGGNVQRIIRKRRRSYQ